MISLSHALEEQLHYTSSAGDFDCRAGRHATRRSSGRRIFHWRGGVRRFTGGMARWTVPAPFVKLGGRGTYPPDVAQCHVHRGILSQRATILADITPGGRTSEAARLPNGSSFISTVSCETGRPSSADPRPPNLAPASSCGAT